MFSYKSEIQHVYITYILRKKRKHIKRYKKRTGGKLKIILYANYTKMHHYCK